MRKILQYIFLMIFWGQCLLVSFCRDAFAEEVYLKNQDRISGTIIEEAKDNIVLKTQDLGTLTIKRESIEKIVSDLALLETTNEPPKIPKEERKEKFWKKEIALGYSMSHGNTEKQRTSGRMFLRRKTKTNEIIVKADSFYSSTDKKMDTQRFNGMVHYGFSFTPSLKWYNFYRVEGDHDRFANVDCRVTPFTGVGYWFFDEEKIKLMAELGVGLEYTNYADEKESNKKNIVTPQIFVEKSLWGKSKISQSVTLYLPPEDTKDYRVHLEAAFTNPIDQYWALRLSLIDDFNNLPGGQAKKNDLRLVSSLVYSF